MGVRWEFGPDNTKEQITAIEKRVTTVESGVKELKSSVTENTNNINLINTINNQQDTQINKNKQDISTISDSVNLIKGDLQSQGSEIESIKSTQTGILKTQSEQGTLLSQHTTQIADLNSNKQNKINNSDDIGINQQQNTAYLQPVWKDKINNLVSQVEQLSQLVQTLQNTITQLSQTVQAQQDYIDQLKPRIGINSTSTNLIAPNGTSQLSINNDGAYKNVGSGWEHLASTPWIQSNYYSKSDFNNYSIVAKLAAGTTIGQNDNYGLVVDTYQSNQVYMSFVTPDSNGEGKITTNKGKAFSSIGSEEWRNR